MNVFEMSFTIDFYLLTILVGFLRLNYFFFFASLWGHVNPLLINVCELFNLSLHKQPQRCRSGIAFSSHAGEWGSISSRNRP